MKYCPNCGTEALDEAKFCQNCGTEYSFPQQQYPQSTSYQPPPPAQPYQPPPPAQPYQPPKEQKSKFFIFLIILTVIIVGLFIIGIGFGGNPQLEVTVISNNYSGYFHIDIDGYEKHREWISDGDTIVLTFSLSAGEHLISFSYGASGGRTETINIYSDMSMTFETY